MYISIHIFSGEKNSVIDKSQSDSNGHAENRFQAQGLEFEEAFEGILLVAFDRNVFDSDFFIVHLVDLCHLSQNRNGFKSSPIAY